MNNDGEFHSGIPLWRRDIILPCRCNLLRCAYHVNPLHIHVLCNSVSLPGKKSYTHQHHNLIHGLLIIAIIMKSSMQCRTSHAAECFPGCVYMVCCRCHMHRACMHQPADVTTTADARIEGSTTRCANLLHRRELWQTPSFHTLSTCKAHACIICKRKK